MYMHMYLATEVVNPLMPLAAGITTILLKVCKLCVHNVSTQHNVTIHITYMFYSIITTRQVAVTSIS